LAANHNHTFALARGEFFKWAAHDDDFPRQMLRRFVAVLADVPPSISLVYSHCESIDELGNVQGLDSDGIARNDPSPHKRLAHLLRNLHMYNSPYGLIRSTTLRKTRLYGHYPMSDRVLLAELAMLGVIIEVPEPLLRIRQHPGRTFTAHTQVAALREIFLPGSAHRASLLSMKKRAELELIRSAVLVPEEPRDKVLCTAVAVAKPQWENFRSFGGRHRRKLLAALSHVSRGNS
jgi:hypothetical protein